MNWRLATTMVAVALLLSNAPVQAGVPGDVTGDGFVNVADVQCTVLKVLKLDPPACLANADAADLNCDGKANVADVQLSVLIVLNHPEPGVPADKDVNGNNIVDDCEAQVWCPDGECDYLNGENCSTCPADCGSCCGNGACQSGLDEDCATCPKDCGDCCGNGKCMAQFGENCLNCQADCGSCCGNNKCEWAEYGETCKNCQPDCSPCPTTCGDGMVEGGEVCDDGNQENGDGCSEDCLLEFDDPLAQGIVIVTEIMKGPVNSTDEEGEWVELLNVGAKPVDLAGWVIKDAGQDQHTIASNSLVVEPGAYLLLAISEQVNPDDVVLVDYVYDGFHLDDDDQVILLAPGGELIDQVHYTADEFPDTPGKSMNLQPTVLDHIANDSPANWCAASNQMANGDYGTPRALNLGCQWSAHCGNGTLEWGEDCDDGNVKGCDGCDSQCQLDYPPICGNNVKETCEQCEDGNLLGGDGCSEVCTIEGSFVCGNGLVEPGEECDDGNDVEGDACSDDCKKTGVCGNGIIEPGEHCDDGNSKDGDGCGAMCHLEGQPLCGNKIIEGTEWCDDGCDKGIPTVCEPIIDDGDGCDWECFVEGPKPLQCGNGLVEPKNAEDCDDGCMLGIPNECEEGIDDGDGCSHECKTDKCAGVCCPEPCCGDGTIQEELAEECDDMNLDNEDGCTNECKFGAVVPVAPGVVGTVTYVGQPSLTDALVVIVSDAVDGGCLSYELLEYPPKGVDMYLPFDPIQPYWVSVEPGTYRVSALVDENNDGIDEMDLCIDYPYLVVVEADKLTYDIDFKIVADPQPASISGTVAFPEGWGPEDSARVMLSEYEPSDDYHSAVHVSWNQEDYPFHYEFSGLMPANYRRPVEWGRCGGMNGKPNRRQDSGG